MQQKGKKMGIKRSNFRRFEVLKYRKRGTRRKEEKEKQSGRTLKGAIIKQKIN